MKHDIIESSYVYVYRLNGKPIYIGIGYEDGGVFRSRWHQGLRENSEREKVNNT